jgi:polyhydroxybutyrate depolymerase
MMAGGAMNTRLIRLLVTIAGVVVLVILIGALAFRLVNRTNGTLVSSGEKRSYLLYVPDSYDPSVPAPLVITIHGFAQWPAHQMHITGWNDLADEHGFLVVYPAGTRFPLRWRTWAEPGREQEPVIEVAFIADLIDELEKEYNLDPARVYVNGLSNGGGMSFLLACRLSERIAAIGIVAPALVTPWEECQPSRPVPTIVFHGTADPIVPYSGGPFPRGGLEFPSIPEWVDVLAQRNGCGPMPLELEPAGSVSGLEYTACSADVIFYTIAGGGHSWPGGQPIPVWIAGETTADIDATRVMWEFFQSHPLPGESVP